MYKHQYNPYGANIEIVKGYLKSGKTLALGILYLLSIAASAFAVVTIFTGGSVYDYAEMLRSMGIDPSQANIAVSSSVGSATVSVIAATFISFIFTLLAAIGFIVMFAKSRNESADSNPSGGASILRAISLIGFICAIICVVFLVALFVIAYFFLDYFVAEFHMDSQAAEIIWIAGGVAILLFSFFYIFYTAACKNFYRSIKRSLNSVDLHTKGSVAYGVFNIIGAVFVGLALIGSVISVITAFSTANLVSLIAAAISFLSSVLVASFALGYNSYIKRQKLSYIAPNGPGSGMPAYNTPAPQQGDPAAYRDNFSDYNASQQSVPAHCPNCGAPSDGLSPYCANCGAKL